MRGLGAERIFALPLFGKCFLPLADNKHNGVEALTQLGVHSYKVEHKKVNGTEIFQTIGFPKWVNFF